MRGPTSGVVPASGGSGSGLPSGGAVNQTVLNTAPGAGTWQDVAAAMAAGSPHLVLTDVAHIATLDLSAADKATLAGLAVHHAEYRFDAFSLANNSQVPPTGAVWTSVTDTDSYGTALVASGAFTVPAGLGGLYIITATCEYPAAAYSQLITLLSGLPTNATASNPEQRVVATFTNAIQGQNVAWSGSLTAGTTVSLTLFQVSGAGQSVKGIFTIALIAPTTSSAGVSGLVPIAKSGAYTALANDWVLCDTTGGTFAVTTPAAPIDGEIFAVTWRAGGAAPTITGTVLGSPTFGAVGNTIWLRYSTITTSWLVV